MKFFIKEWADDTATLMTEHGQVIWTFSSAQEAIEGCAEWAGTKDQLPRLVRVQNREPLNSAA